jgi:hypothetical protein
VAGTERAVGAGTNDNTVAAAGVDVDARGAGRLVAGFGAQVDAVGFGQPAGQGAAGVVAQRADESGARPGAGRGDGLVETLAARAGALQPGDG